MGYRFSVLKGENQTLSTGNVLMALQTAAAATTTAGIVKIKRLEIGQSGSTTLAMIRGEIAQRDTAGTLTTTAFTPLNISPVGGSASGLTGNTSVIGGAGRAGITSTADSGGTYTSLVPFAFANTSGYLWKPDPDEEIFLGPSTVLVVRFLAAPATLTGWTYHMILGENV